MSIVVVTGMGPRTGTSFVMQRALAAGLPIVGKKFPVLTVPSHNPDGYWESIGISHANMDGHIAKIWYEELAKIDHSLISRVVVLERKDKLAQMHSIYKVFKDECKLWPALAKRFTPSDVIYKHNKLLNHWLDQRDQNTVMRVHTEGLNSSIDEVLLFLERGL
jgi:hypothetical protein